MSQVVSGFVRGRRPGRLTIPALLAVAALVGACSSDTGPDSSLELSGASVNIGNGSAHTYVVTSPSGASTIGVSFTPTALDGLPSTDAMWDLPLPTGTALPPWDHVTINWNAQGHPPQPYMLPHFDFHFYVVSPAQQAAVQPGPDTVTVPAANVPQDYVSGVDAVPDMGVHWIDTTSAELHGHTFDHTLIYGFYHGGMMFIEPMITRAFLASHPDVTVPVKQPQSFQKPGRYPTYYSVTTDGSGNVRVALDSLRER
ncbi:MAG TPA: DUF5602 domain-containing protein [Gemmatimonadaceae bacterium]|nr:DUF5602 domain-containing protein [Gemmatimonadaceae bacterium]